MAWYGSRPYGTDDIRDLVVHMPENWAYLQSALSAQHTFPGSQYGLDAGKHIQGQVSYLFYGTSAEIITLHTDYNVPEGALSYDTENWRLWYYAGGWEGFNGLVHRKLGWMTGNLHIPGPYLDGRDPSVDGAKLDLISALAVASGVQAQASVQHDEFINVPTTPPSANFERSDCYWVAIQKVILQVAACSVDTEGQVSITAPSEQASHGAYCVSIGVK